jgi:hypothetical protein
LDVSSTDRAGAAAFATAIEIEEIFATAGHELKSSENAGLGREKAKVDESRRRPRIKVLFLTTSATFRHETQELAKTPSRLTPLGL